MDNFLKLELFFSALLQGLGPEHQVGIWTPTNYNQTVHVPADDAHAATAAALEQAAKHDTYYNVCTRAAALQLSPTRRGGKDAVSSFPGPWVEIDFGPHHSADNLPTDLEQSVELLDASRLPDPTFLIHSGGGIQALWLLEQPVIFSSPSSPEARACESLCKALQAKVIATAAQRGWHVDSTGNIDRALRVPWTVNRKAGLERPTSVLLDGPRHNLDALRLSITGSVTGPALSASSPASPLLSGDTGVPGETGSADPVTIPRVTVEQARALLTRVRKPEMLTLARRVIDATPLADRGSRNRDMHRAVCLVATVAPGLTDEDAVALLTPSVMAMMERDAAESDPGPTLDELSSMVERELPRIRERAQTERAELARWRARLSPGDALPLPEADARKLVSDATGVTPEQAHQRLVLHHAGAYYLMREPGKYTTPVPRVQMDSSFREWLPRWFPVATTRFTEEGIEKDIMLDKLLRDNSTSGTNIRLTLVEGETHFDAESLTIIEAPLKRRKLEPLFNPQIDQWLRLLGGTEAERLLDWVATVDMLDRPSAALYLTGTPSSGKTMLASGLARIYHEGPPTPLADVLSDWNSGILSCPLVLADEELPSKMGRATTSESLRALITSDGQTVKRKFLPNVPLTGSLRLLIATNNEKLLDFDELMTEHDAQAIAARFLWVRVGSAPVEFIANIGGRSGGTDAWVAGDGIARHALWLAANRVVKPGSRFVVEGEIGALRHRIVTRTRLASLVCEWLATYALRSNLAPEIANKGDVLFGDGVVLVRAAAVADFWEKFVKSDKPRSVETIGRVLSSWHRDIVAIGKRKYRLVQSSVLLSWVEEAMPESVDDIKAKLNKPRVLPPAVVKEMMATAAASADADTDAAAKS